jgi:excisionase family DNA binding protein
MDTGKDLYSTFQAAKVLGVSPDTVLKWIKAGKIPASRTLGGHYRIGKDTMDELLSERESPYPTAKTTAPRKTFQYCWEFNSKGDKLEDGCRNCLVYNTRAKLCYEMSSVPKELGHLKLFCESECEDCDYYKYVKERSLNVLVITNDREFLGDLRVSGNVSFKITNCEYECSAIVEKMRPEIAVIDCSFRKSKDFFGYLTNDPRIPDIGIILASDTEIPFDYSKERIIGLVSTPLTIEKIEEYVKGISA